MIRGRWSKSKRSEIKRSKLEIDPISENTVLLAKSEKKRGVSALAIDHKLGYDIAWVS